MLFGKSRDTAPHQPSPGASVRFIVPQISFRYHYAFFFHECDMLGRPPETLIQRRVVFFSETIMHRSWFSSLVDSESGPGVASRAASSYPFRLLTVYVLCSLALCVLLHNCGCYVFADSICPSSGRCTLTQEPLLVRVAADSPASDYCCCDSLLSRWAEHVQ
jgi:hypothetical protein